MSSALLVITQFSTIYQNQYKIGEVYASIYKNCIIAQHGTTLHFAYMNWRPLSYVDESESKFYITIA